MEKSILQIAFLVIIALIYLIFTSIRDQRMDRKATQAMKEMESIHDSEIEEWERRQG